VFVLGASLFSKYPIVRGANDEEIVAWEHEDLWLDPYELDAVRA